MKLEDVTNGASLEGVEPSSVVTVVAAIPIPPDSLQLIYRLPDGALRERLLSRADEAVLALATAAHPWSFDGDGAAFQLTARRVLIVAPGGLVEQWRDECPAAWDPRSDTRVLVWEALHQIIRALRGEGDSGAGRLLAAVQPKSEAIRQLAYRLYTLCERRGEAERARAYNELITSWSAVAAAAGEVPETMDQLDLFEGKT